MHESLGLHFRNMFSINKTAQDRTQTKKIGLQINSQYFSQVSRHHCDLGFRKPRSALQRHGTKVPASPAEPELEDLQRGRDHSELCSTKTF